MTEIVVQGSAESAVPADQAVVHASVSVSDASRDTAVSQAGEAHARLTHAAQELSAAGAATTYAAGAVTSYSNSWRDEHGSLISEHHAQAQVRVTVVALERVSEIAADLTALGADVTISWELNASHAHEVQRGLRNAAVENARQTAQDYAHALGASRIEATSLRDAQSGMTGPVRSDALFARSASVVPEVTVGEITVTANVEMTFIAS